MKEKYGIGLIAVLALLIVVALKNHLIEVKSNSPMNLKDEGNLTGTTNQSFSYIESSQPSPSSSAATIASSTTTLPAKNHATCSKKPCINLLSKSSLSRYKNCARSGPVTKERYNCVFRDGQGIDPIALVSFPGSGNTWTRGLLEKATGICTGAVYCDSNLRRSGFIGEGLRDGNVLVIKTHAGEYQWKGVKLKVRFSANALYGSAILLIRNPFDALVSERNRELSHDHVGLSSKAYFGTNKDWDAFVKSYGERWKKTILNWVGSAHKFHKPLLVVRYEDLKEDRVEQVSRMLDFLQQDYNRTELAARLDDGYEKFHRKQKAKAEYDHYTEEQREAVNTLITKTIKELDAMGIESQALRLDQYVTQT